MLYFLHEAMHSIYFLNTVTIHDDENSMKIVDHAASFIKTNKSELVTIGQVTKISCSDLCKYGCVYANSLLTKQISGKCMAIWSYLIYSFFNFF
jgi:hypothetical protein